MNYSLTTMRITAFLFLLFILANTTTFAQDPQRFHEEIKRFADIKVDSSEVAIFTGSSSIRLWEDLAEDCQQLQTVNTGFGGSHMSDLLYYLEQTVLRFKPTSIYIYEGDNDIAEGKSPSDIIETAQRITQKILASNPQSLIYFISAKPSPSRWNYKTQYEAFNTLMKDYCESHSQLFFIDVWNPMLTDSGRPKPHIFIADSLHMNRQGYILWKDSICKE